MSKEMSTNLKKAVAAINQKYSVDLNNLNINLTSHTHRKLLDLIGTVDKTMYMSSHELAQMATEFNEDGNAVEVFNINASVRTMLKNNYGIIVNDVIKNRKLLKDCGDYCECNDERNQLVTLVRGVDYVLDDRGYVKSFYLDQTHAMFVITNYSDRIKMAILRTFEMVKEMNTEYQALLLEQSKRVINAYQVFAGHNDWMRVDDRLRQTLKVSRKTFKQVLSDIGTSQTLKDFTFKDRVLGSQHARMISHQQEMNGGYMPMKSRPFISLELVNALRKKYPEEVVDIDAGELLGI